MKVTLDRDIVIKSLKETMSDTAEMRDAIRTICEIEPEPGKGGIIYADTDSIHCSIEPSTRPRPNAIVQTILDTPSEQLDEYISSLSDEKYNENAFYIICNLINYIKKGE